MEQGGRGHHEGPGFRRHGGADRAERDVIEPNSDLLRDLSLGGFDQMVADLERLTVSCKVTELACNLTWTTTTLLPEGRLSADEALENLGMPDPALRARLLMEVWP
jgi:hypothetical protein